ncbi:hypothetical protein LX15_002707 [Streptoalloteichus tenebrarius]|uniref:NAD(P)-binding domain-containing protein n=1 Tax=Streptoalloteichus tenebrarius (strain ATCC 17920 / DSM 40477 / JCM 4838 / CBS 697.72 / NBRC 16177 / NCIMB 11028 / NRRL B-12390 / A12253. 1 / ISP 5477) TaxID=1933 RepID=A0ABT1HU01_STRSD|nr:NAD(P)-dependent oxidoreductase [Streptoalloteichus tenebrarius]MCP2259008.1 hypothetical protein [Streptoalloteichus tenebrarius]BFF01221.1 NAD(P)-dependent oxidoreductase [Streptoalloteichus tenebrarius]
MKLVLVGATGMIGRRVLDEALRRGHEVTAVARNASGPAGRPGLTVRTGSLFDAPFLADVVAGADVLISAISSKASPGATLADAARRLLDAARTAGARLVVVGGAGSLEVAPGALLVDTPDFPAAYLPEARAQADALAALRAEGDDVDWTYLSPAAEIAPGERTGRFRLGGDQLLVDDSGASRISVEDYAVALLDEVEKPAHTRQRFTVAY